jgi:undecaprenyl-diphosphatase
MNVVQAIVLGFVEGITEFLPISSTFHLLVTADILKIPQNDFVKLFEVFIQSAAILAVLLLYWKDLVKDRRLVKNILISFVPTALIGFALYSVIKNIFFEEQLLMVGAFIIVGVIFLIIEKSIKNEKLRLTHTTTSITIRDALLIGLVQALAVIPGVSRSGIVIVGMMLLRYKRDEAARYSFILSIPTIFMASAYDLYKMRYVVGNYTDSALLLIIGSISAFISAYIVVRWLIGYLQRNTLELFGYYRIVAAIILLTLFL